MATREELVRMTKAELVEMLLLQGDAPAPDPGLISFRTLVFADGAGGRTTMRTNGLFESVAMGRTIPNGVTVEGAGDVLTVHLDTLYMYAGDVIEWDPAPDAQPIRLVLSTEE